ncbi:hypothetical protein [uncultured Cetobacterium sp.]|uniref:hypothetical protein n=1 Tax=uncultured Cetobacterium sp. TaxID=527638 RepID=UPI00260A5656|nr:hypothetical protein [uncultured Cetobacterium sp.]
MKKLMLAGFMVVSMGLFANSENVIIDKEVTGVNQEQLIIPKSTSTDVKLSTDAIKLEDKNISADNYKDQKQIIQLSDKDNDLNKSLIEDKGTPIWKYVIGIVALVTLGVAL